MGIDKTTGVNESEKKALEILEKIANQLEALNVAVSNLGEVAQQLIERKEVGAPEKPAKFDEKLDWFQPRTKARDRKFVDKNHPGWTFGSDERNPANENLLKLVGEGRLVEMEGVVWDVKVSETEYGVFIQRNAPKVK